MHSPHATWETGLVIPETAKTVEEQMLASFLRIEALPTELLGKPDLIPVSQDVADMVEEAVAPKPAKTTKRK